MDRTIAAPESVGMSTERLARIKPCMQSFLDQYGYAGISTMLARHGQIIHYEHIGYQDRESKAALTADTIFRIYSMTKPIICTAFMTLYEEGRFQLYTPVSKYLPAFDKLRVMTGLSKADPKEVDLLRPITIRDLLTHTSGLTYNFLFDNPVSEMYREAGLMRDANRSLADTIDDLTRMPLSFQPGKKWHYSMAIDVIAHLIQVISGQSLQSFLEERIFKPLGMLDTGFSVAPEKQQRLANMYGHPDISTSTLFDIFLAWKSGFNQRIDLDQTYPSNNTSNFARGGHGLFSTAWDYMRFAQMLLNRGELDGVRILSPRIVDFMHTNHVPMALLPYEIGGVVSAGYGFGLGSRVLLNPTEAMLPGSAGEFGWSGAANTYYWVDPKEDLIGILMTQFMVGFEMPEKFLYTLAYQALLD